MCPIQPRGATCDGRVYLWKSFKFRDEMIKIKNSERKPMRSRPSVVPIYYYYYYYYDSDKAQPNDKKKVRKNRQQQ